MLRLLSRDDIDEVAITYRESFDDQFPWLVGFHSPAEDRAFFRDRVFGECEVWGAIDKELIGFIAFRTGWIDQLYILSHRQRQGTGGALLQIAKAANSSLQLWTFQRNLTALRFYAQQDFFEIEKTDGRRNEEREPDVLFRWQTRHTNRLDVINSCGLL